MTAAAAPVWAGAAAGVTAIALFVVFSGWILVQRLRGRTSRDNDHG